MSLIAFMRARIADEEAFVRSLETTISYRPRWITDLAGKVVVGPPQAIDIRESMLAECRAKRRVLEIYCETFWLDPGAPDEEREAATSATAAAAMIRALAAAFAWHSEYRPEWWPLRR